MVSHFPFERLGAATPAGPVILSVPHAGRAYSAALMASARVPLDILRQLEDRYIDEVARLAHGGITTFIQHAPRALIDLNRSEQDRDPLVDDGADPLMLRPTSPKIRGGLGLVPRRVGDSGNLWRRRFTAAEIKQRIDRVHRPYHQALGQALNDAHGRYGTAVLLDLHSMPPLAQGHPRIVLGDRFGSSASARFLCRMEAVISGSGLTYSRNSPYAGGHILASHGRPAEGVHAVQLEVDRSLYLDDDLVELGPGWNLVTALIAKLIAALADEALTLVALAAE